MMPLLTYIFFQLCFVLTDFYGKLAGMADDEIDDIMDAPTDDLFGDPKMVAARRTELRRKAGEAARARDRQAGGGGVAGRMRQTKATRQTEEEATGGRTTRVGRPRGGMKVAARIGEGLRREMERGRRPRVRVGDG